MVVIVDDAELVEAVRDAKKADHDLRAATKMIDELVAEVDALKAVVKNQAAEYEKRLKRKDNLIDALQKENNGLNHELYELEGKLWKLAQK